MTIGFVVGGRGERAALSRWTNKRLIHMANGLCCTASVDAISRQTLPLVRLLLEKKCDIVVIVLDRELQGASSSQLERNIEERMSQELPDASVFAACPDRMLENWMLADVKSWSGKHGTKSSAQKKSEGKHGKDLVKALFKPGHHYRETLHGPLFIAAVRTSVARRNSASFARFQRHVSG